jgi:hypothetical protein
VHRHRRPLRSGKTTLLEAILARAGASTGRARVRRSTVGDGSAEARAHAMSVEPNVATATFLGESFTFVDCPGSVEFLHDMRSWSRPATRGGGLRGGRQEDPALAVVLRELEEADIPRFLFINKIDAGLPARCARRWRCCSAPRARRCCFARSRSGRTASPSASSTSRWSAPSSTASTCRAR